MPAQDSNQLTPAEHSALLKEWADLRVRLVGTPLYAARVNEQHASAYARAVRDLSSASPGEVRDAELIAIRASNRLFLLQAEAPEDQRRLMRLEEITFLLARHRAAVAA